MDFSKLNLEFANMQETIKNYNKIIIRINCRIKDNIRSISKMETKVKGNKDKLIKYLANVYIESIKCENDFLNDLIKGDENDGKSGEEIKQLLNSDEKLVYIDNGSEEFVAKYEDLPDIIVDINDKIGSTNLTVMEFDNPSKILLTTFGPFLNKCDSDVRKDIIDRLNNLQQGIEEVKDYKVIDEDMLDDVRYQFKDNDMER